MWRLQTTDISSLGSDTVGIDASGSEKKIIWEAWAAQEVQRRAILGHYSLDGFIAQDSGSPSSARHVINQLAISSSDAPWGATTADDWIRAMHATKMSNCSVSEAFRRICGSRYRQFPLQLSPFSILVVLEGLQALISELHEVGDSNIVVSWQEVMQGLINIYSVNISTIPATTGLRVGTAIQWHAVCIETSISSTALYCALCNNFGLPQLIAGISPDAAGQDMDIESWSKSSKAVRSLLHASTIVDLLRDVTLGSMHAIHLPSAVFSSAIIHIALCLYHEGELRIPRSWLWRDVYASEVGEQLPLGANDEQEPVTDFALGRDNFGKPTQLLQDVNFLQLILKMMASRWGVSQQMEAMVGHLEGLAQERLGMRHYENLPM